MSQTPCMQTNHYPIRPDLQLPYSGDGVRLLNRMVGRHLAVRGFLRELVGRPWYLQLSPEPAELARGAIRLHRVWTWELEWHSGRVWLVPVQQHRWLSALPPDAPATVEFLHTVGLATGFHGVNVGTGERGRFTRRGGELLVSVRGTPWTRCDTADWRVTLSPRDMKRADAAALAQRQSAVTFPQLTQRIEAGPFADLLDLSAGACTREPAWATDGTAAHYRFRNGTGRHATDIRRLGMARPPARAIRLLLAAPQGSTQGEAARMEDVLRGHAFPAARLGNSRGERALRAIGAGRNGNGIATWLETMGVPPFDVRDAPFVYQAATGFLLRQHRLRLEKLLRDMPERELDHAVVLLTLDESVGAAARDRLRGEFRRISRQQLVKTATLVGARYAWTNLAVSLAVLGGAVPYRLAGLPGADTRTLFVGLDLGHDHRKDRSVAGITVYRSTGECVASERVRLGRNDERLALHFIERIPRIVERAGIGPTRLVVHRDGRYLHGEVEDLLGTLAAVAPVSLVAVKKDSCTRLHAPGGDGLWMRLSGSRAVLVTNTQAERRSMPRPLEVELAHAGGLSLDDAVRQVYWLCRVYAGSISHASRLPATTRGADRIAGTGGGGR